jgi:hypothetical protein
MRLLLKRGEFIMDSKNKELIDIEHKINKILEKEGDKMSEPVKAFIIFQDEEGYQRAANLHKKTVCFQT